MYICMCIRYLMRYTFISCVHAVTIIKKLDTCISWLVFDDFIMKYLQLVWWASDDLCYLFMFLVTCQGYRTSCFSISVICLINVSITSSKLPSGDETNFLGKIEGRSPDLVVTWIARNKAKVILKLLYVVGNQHKQTTFSERRRRNTDTMVKLNLFLQLGYFWGQEPARVVMATFRFEMYMLAEAGLNVVQGEQAEEDGGSCCT